jgi:alpha-tubulin suppressor-like RCC1 family protein
MHRTAAAAGSLLLLLLTASACQLAVRTGAPLSASGITAGGNLSCVVEDGGGKCWGENANGQLGDGTAEARNVPTAVTATSETIAALSPGYIHTCALTAAGEIICWGTNQVDQSGGGVLSGYAAVAAGTMHTCGITTGGGVRCWGSNSMGGLGDGTTENRRIPVDVVGLSGGVTAVAAGVEFTCAVQNGAAKCWGANDSGQLGDGTYLGHAAPVNVSGLESDVAGVATGVFHACAWMRGGDGWCWGESTSGELGDGTNQSSPLPVKISGLDGGIRMIAVGGGHACALTKSGGVKCWGSNAFGQLGDGTTTDRNAPVDVVGLSGGVAAVAAGAGHTCALLDGGAVKCWGANQKGQLGNGTNSDSRTPVDVLRAD